MKLNWNSPIIIHNQLESVNEELQRLNYGYYGSEYPRMTRLADGSWIIVYTYSDYDGYRSIFTAGLKLEIALSSDNGRTWVVQSMLSDLGRDLDNGHIIELKDGVLLMGCRSVRWQESYKIDIYASHDRGKSWTFRSTVDENHGEPGSLGEPDKGMYEPHFFILLDGRLSVMYANEIHVTEVPSFSQIITQRISEDAGSSWGEEIWVAWDPHDPASRPGMPVWDRMKDGKYIVVYEVCGTHGCNVYNKISSDGITWAPGIGKAIVGQYGGPYIVSLANGRLLVTSNSGHLSCSSDYGKSWSLLEKPAFPNHWWASVYQTNENEIALLNSMNREEGGHNIQIRFAEIIE
jgi:hypothetical protein